MVAVLAPQRLRLFKEHTCYQVITEGGGVTDGLVMYTREGHSWEITPDLEALKVVR